MPLINCPTCGKPVSDKAENCVHCGVKFNHCKKCGKLFVEEGIFCGNCSAAVTQNISDEHVQDKQVEPNNLKTDNINYLQSFYNDVPRLKKATDKFYTINKIVKIAKWFIYLLDLLMFVLICARYQENLSLKIEIPYAMIYFVMFTSGILFLFGYSNTHVISYIITIQSYKWNKKKDFATPDFLAYSLKVCSIQDNSIEYDRFLDFAGGYTYFKYPKELHIFQFQFWLRAIIECALLFYWIIIFPIIFQQALLINTIISIIYAVLPIIVIYSTNVILFWIFAVWNKIRTRNLFQEENQGVRS